MTKPAASPLFAIPANETLGQRCRRLSDELADYERDIAGRMVLNVTEMRRALEDAARELGA